MKKSNEKILLVNQKTGEVIVSKPKRKMYETKLIKASIKYITAPNMISKAKHKVYIINLLHHHLEMKFNRKVTKDSTRKLLKRVLKRLKV